MTPKPWLTLLAAAASGGNRWIHALRDAGNPEPGALYVGNMLAGQLTGQENVATVVADADLVIANDPDADRLAVSLPFPGGVWKAITGNQIGCLLADFLLSKLPGADGPVINSIVSSPMLATIADAHGVHRDVAIDGEPGDILGRRALIDSPVAQDHHARNGQKKPCKEGFLKN